MGYYIKARKIVHDSLGFATGDRQKTPDGNYLLWQADIVKLGDRLGLKFGSNYYEYLIRVAALVGALVLTAKEAKEEQDGKVQRTLPVATDERFIDDAQRKQLEAEKEAQQDGVTASADQSEETTTTTAATTDTDEAKAETTEEEAEKDE
jgi:hypothetical protein